jgi:hypothetical protein
VHKSEASPPLKDNEGDEEPHSKEEVSATARPPHLLPIAKGSDHESLRLGDYRLGKQLGVGAFGKASNDVNVFLLSSRDAFFSFFVFRLPCHVFLRRPFHFLAEKVIKSYP